MFGLRQRPDAVLVQGARFVHGALLVLGAVALICAIPARAQQPLRIGIITFLSGPAAGPFGVPAKNGADLVVEALNKGGIVPGYENRGFAGRPLELVYVDEAGGPTKQDIWEAI